MRTAPFSDCHKSKTRHCLRHLCGSPLPPSPLPLLFLPPCKRASSFNGAPSASLWRGLGDTRNAKLPVTALLCLWLAGWGPADGVRSKEEAGFLGAAARGSESLGRGLECIALCHWGAPVKGDSHPLGHFPRAGKGAFVGRAGLARVRTPTVPLSELTGPAWAGCRALGSEGS